MPEVSMCDSGWQRANRDFYCRQDKISPLDIAIIGRCYHDVRREAFDSIEIYFLVTILTSTNMTK